MKGRIFNIQKFSIHDGPGIRTTVFLKGCLLSCEWCANPESQNEEPEIIVDRFKCVKCHTCFNNAPKGTVTLTEEEYPEFSAEAFVKSHDYLEGCPVEALSVEGEYQDSDEIVRICMQDKDFYDESGGGVTISGGEGMIQPDFLKELVGKLKVEGVHLAIETTGYVESDDFKELAPLFDLLLYDIKHYDSDCHKEGTGVENEKILDNLAWALNNNLDVLVRIPVIPGFNDSLEDAEGFAELFNDYGVKKVQLLPFHQFGENKYKKLNRNYKYEGIPSLHPEDLDEFKQILVDNGIDCFI